MAQSSNLETIFEEIDNIDNLCDLNTDPNLEKVLDKCFYDYDHNDDNLKYDIKDIEEYLSILQIEIKLSKYLGQIIYYLGKTEDSYDDINSKLSDFNMISISSGNYNDIYKDIHTITIDENEWSQSLTIILTFKIKDYINIDIMFNGKLYIRTIKLESTYDEYSDEDYE